MVQPLVRAHDPVSNPKETCWSTRINICFAGEREESLYGGRRRTRWKEKGWNTGGRKGMGLEGGDMQCTIMSTESLHVCLIYANKMRHFRSKPWNSYWHEIHVDGLLLSLLPKRIVGRDPRTLTWAWFGRDHSGMVFMRMFLGRCSCLGLWRIPHDPEAVGKKGQVFYRCNRVYIAALDKHLGMSPQGDHCRSSTVYTSLQDLWGNHLE